MIIKACCEHCNKLREINCELVARGDNRWLQGVCQFCGEWWFKKYKDADDVNQNTGKHLPLKWVMDYLKEETELHWRGCYSKRPKNWKGIKGDLKIEKEVKK